MKIVTRHIVAGLAAAAALGGAATAAAAPALPDLTPYIEQTPDNADFPTKWYVELVPQSGDQPAKLLLHFPARINNVGAGTFEIGADGTTGLDPRIFPFPVFDKELPVRQILTGPTPADTDTRSLEPARFRLVGDQFGVSDTWYWRASGLARYALESDAGGPAVESQLRLTYWNDELTGDPAADPNNPSDANASTFTPTLTAGSGDSYPLARAITDIPLDNNYIDVTDVRPGPATFTAEVLSGGATADPAVAGRVLESNVANNSASADLAVPGVIAQSAAAGTAFETPVAFDLSAESAGAGVPIKRGDAPAAPEAPGDLAYAIIGLDPAQGTATVTGKTVLFTPAAGFSGTATFGYTATEQGRGLAGGGAITVAVAERPGGPGGPGGPSDPNTPPWGARGPNNDGVGAGGLPIACTGGLTIPTEPPATPDNPGAVTLSRNQLLINQRISQAAVRRVNAVIDKLTVGLTGAAFRPCSLGTADFDPGLVTAIRAGSPNGPAGQVAKPRTAPVRPNAPSHPERVRLSVQQLLINQRISQAAVRRVNAIRGRLSGNLTAGDILAGSLPASTLDAGARNWFAKGLPAGASLSGAFVPLTLAPASDDPSRVRLSAEQLLINQRISQAAVRRINQVRRELEAGLTGAYVKDGSLPRASLAPQVQIGGR